MERAERVVFDRHVEEARLLSPLEGFAEVASRTEHRRDPLTGRVAIVGLNLAGKRAALYPDTDEAHLAGIAERTRAGCFFCPERVETATPRFPASLRGEESGRLGRGSSLLFPNLFPLAEVHGVVALGREHFLPLDRFAPELLGEGLALGVELVRRATRAGGGARAFVVCGNYLGPGGASIVHPHLQVLGSARPLTTHAVELEASRRYHERHGACYLDDLLAVEEARGERFVGRTTGGVGWVAAFAPRGNNELLGVCPAARDLAALGEAELRGLAEGLSASLRTYHAMRLSTFNFCLYGAPVGEGGEAHRVFLSVVSRQSVAPDYRCDDYFLQKMLGTEILVDPPEELARALGDRLGRGG